VLKRADALLEARDGAMMGREDSNEVGIVMFHDATILKEFADCTVPETERHSFVRCLVWSSKYRFD